MNFFFLHHPQKNWKDDPVEPSLVAIEEHDHDIAEGGEFLDDAIRMKEQPFILMRGEESIAPGGRKDLL